MLEQYTRMKEAKFEVETRLEKYNFDTKLTNKLLDSLVVQKGKSGLGFTRVEPPLNHNYSCNLIDSCVDDFTFSTSLFVNPPIVDVCDDNSSLIIENVDDNVLVDCVGLNATCDDNSCLDGVVETVDT